MKQVSKRLRSWASIIEENTLNQAVTASTMPFIVVEGKGNRLALNSSPHGAGREYSRSRARKTFTHADLRTAMAGIEYRDTDAFIDEIPAAYKSIDQVMADANDLVTIKHTLRQIVNVKGD